MLVGQMAVTHCRHQGAPREATPSPLEKTPRIHKGWDPRRVGSTEGLGPEEFCSPFSLSLSRPPAMGSLGRDTRSATSRLHTAGGPSERGHLPPSLAHQPFLQGSSIRFSKTLAPPRDRRRMGILGLP